MALFDRTTLALGLWFLILLAGALLLKAVFVASRILPARMSLVIALPAETSDTDRQNLESGVAALGADLEFIPKEAGLAALRARLLAAGFPQDTVPAPDTLPPADTIPASDTGLSADTSPPPSTGVLVDIPENPVPDVYVVRSTDPDRYADIAILAVAIIPGARVEYDAAALRKLTPVLRSARFLAIAWMILMSVLFCLSAADRLTIAARAAPPDPARGHFKDVLVQCVRPAALAALGGILIAGGCLTALGFAADRRPDLWIRPYADLAGRIIRELPMDGWFAASCILGWAGLIVLTCLLHAAGAQIGRRTGSAVLVSGLLMLNSHPGMAASQESGREKDLQAVHTGVMKQIREKEKEYEREQEKLKETRRSAVELSKKERRLLKRLTAAEQSLSKTRAELTVLNTQLDALKKDIHAAQEKWDSQHSSLEHRRRLYVQRLGSFYLLSARLNWPSALIAAGDLSIPAQTRIGLVRVADQDRALIGVLRARKAETEKIQQLLDAKEKQLLAVQDRKRSLEQRQERERVQRLKLLDEIRGRKSAMDEMARQLEEESNNLKLLVTALREQALKVKEQLAYLKKEFEDRKGLLRWPLASAAIRSVRPYGKFHDEVLKTTRLNKGIDILTETNQSVVAVSKGEVVYANFFGHMGNLVILSHGGDYFTLYAHLSEISVKEGVKLETGDPLGRAGNTGLLEDQAILHFEIRQGSQSVDPQDWLGRR